MASTTTKKKNTARKHAGIKAVRQSTKRATANRMKHADLDKQMRLFKASLKENNKEKAIELQRLLQKAYAKAAKNHILPVNKARRNTSSIAKLVSKTFPA